jgi:hypothetical protein
MFLTKWNARMSTIRLSFENRRRISLMAGVIGILMLMFAVPVLARPSFADSTIINASHTSSGASISLSYSVKTTSSGTTIYVTVSSKDSQYPSYVDVSLSSYFNGATTAFNSQTVTLAPSHGSVSFLFSVPGQGSGNYLFVGRISATSGSLICQASIDPFIKSGR